MSTRRSDHTHDSGPVTGLGIVNLQNIKPPFVVLWLLGAPYLTPFVRLDVIIRYQRSTYQLKTSPDRNTSSPTSDPPLARPYLSASKRCSTSARQRQLTRLA